MSSATHPNAVGADMGWRFATGDWARAGGNLQSIVFAREILNQIVGRGLFSYEWAGRLHDYGCAEGDGTAYMAAVLPNATVSGFDITREAVYKASARWEGIRFEIGDVRAPAEEADLIVTSHTLEHLADPVGALTALVEKAPYVVAVTPIITAEQNGGHEGALLTDDYVAGIESAFGPYAMSLPVYQTRRRDPDGNTWSESNLLYIVRRP